MTAFRVKATITLTGEWFVVAETEREAEALVRSEIEDGTIEPENHLEGPTTYILPSEVWECDAHGFRITEPKAKD